MKRLLNKNRLLNKRQILRLLIVTSLPLLVQLITPQATSGKTPKFYFQGRKVTGKVTDDKGAALANVSVIIKNTTQGTTTNETGEFTITAPDEKSVLVISYVGFVTREITVGTQSQVNVTMAADAGQLNDVVVVGYGTQKRVTVSGAVASVKGTELQKSPAVNLSNSIAGRLPGVIATNNSGEPGYDGSTIRIRGSNTLGNNDALIVIDGIPARAGGLERLNPADIESMSVLKDASAAIYGARAANGVILITTKRGKSGKPQLSYNFNQGWARATVIPKMLNAVEYAEMANEIEVYKLDPSLWTAATAAFKETGSYTDPGGTKIDAPFKPDDIQKYRDGSDPWGHPNTDWFKETLKDWSPQSRHNLQLSGGSENLRYLASLGYQNQDAYYKNSATGYKQYDVRVNLDAKVNKYVSTMLGFTARQENRFFPTKSAGSIFRMLMRGYPYAPAYWPNGLPGPDIENGEQPVVITTNQTGYDRDTRYYYQSNGRVEITVPWITGLKITGNAAVDKYVQQGKTWVTPWFIYAFSGYDGNGEPILTKVQKGPTTQATLNRYTQDQLNVLLEAIVSYDHKFGDHQLILLAATTKETSNNNSFGAFRQYFPSTSIDQLFAGGATNQVANGSAWERARLNYFGRVGYNFQEKYIAEFLWRYDGSYMFPKDKRFGFFPGVSAAWRISEEGFMKNVGFVNSLKLRGSWGQLGNDQVYFGGSLREYDYLPTYAYGDRANSNFGYVINNQLTSVLRENGVPNTNITWEVANNYDIGLEATLFNNRVSVELDYFQNRRSKILWRRNASIPASTGMELPAENIGKVANKGYEFKIGYNGNAGDFTYNVNVNGGYAKNKITFWDETPGRPDYQLTTGKPIPNDPFNADNNLIYVYDGVFKDQKDVDANTLDYSGVGGAGKLFPGSMKFKDINGDGKIDGNDRIRSEKNTQPTFQGGLVIGAQYKNFDLSILFQGATGGELFVQTESGTIGNYLKYTYDHRWTVDNPSSVDPRTVDRNNQYFSNRNTYYMMNTNYLRLKNFEIGYTLPSEIGKKVGISSLRVYVNGLNMITWAKQDIFDPESVNSSFQYYPQAKIINTGVSVTF
ncbi:SusC/RagA family TonB-linked outer membrane protein [Foetidibacter luteolus]|uniref:SusC/RagA family TonB-linked outer membrane protein n=1 Tax=Foetidibacter luteolus TaxID=2608880 RepID=UPI00129B1D01|nr:TonB-dependent receptor [Foetidibacter luteolus]